jgi:hypothetical protein
MTSQELLKLATEHLLARAGILPHARGATRRAAISRTDRRIDAEGSDRWVGRQRRGRLLAASDAHLSRQFVLRGAGDRCTKLLRGVVMESTCSLSRLRKGASGIRPVNPS